MDYETYSDIKKKITGRTVTGFWALYDNTALLIAFDDGSEFYVHAKINVDEDGPDLLIQIANQEQVKHRESYLEKL